MEILTIGTTVETTVASDGNSGQYRFMASPPRTTIQGRITEISDGWYKVEYVDSKGRDRFCWLNELSTYTVINQAA